MTLSKYKTFVFDCDGVILDSNKVKSEAFYNVVEPYSSKAATEFLDYHISKGGVSRYKKFAYFQETIAPRHGIVSVLPPLETLLEDYASQVQEALMSCDINEGLTALRDKVPDARWCVVSGGDQAELRHIFSMRGIADLFDGGIFGSPDDKHTILAREIERGTITRPAVFFGDSRLDCEAAKAVNIDVIFLSRWSEFKGWQDYCTENDIETFEGLDSVR